MARVPFRVSNVAERSKQRRIHAMHFVHSNRTGQPWTCSGHPRLPPEARKTWMAVTSTAMTTEKKRRYGRTTMGLLDGKVALITGAGGGLGEAYAKLFAREGASVVVNDLGGPRDGKGADVSMAQKVVDAIKADGGRTVAHGADTSTTAGSRS